MENNISEKKELESETLPAENGKESKPKQKMKGVETEGFRIKDLFQGRIVSNDILFKQWKKIGICIILVFVYISNRYTCQQKIAEIGNLQKQLVDIRYEALTLSSRLMGSSRQSQVKELVKNKKLQLEESKQPPYKLEK